MAIARRTFVLGTGLVASAPAFAHLLLSSSAHSTAAPLQPGSPGTAPALADVEFKIHGWDHDRGGDQLWLSINQSWRTAWR